MSNEPKEHSSGFMAQDRTKVDLIYRQAAIDAHGTEGRGKLYEQKTEI